MTFDPHCPIEPRGVALGEEICIRLFNLSEHTALSICGTIAFGRQSIAFDAPVCAAGRTHFSLRVAFPDIEAPVLPEITFLRIRFQGAPDWVPHAGPRLPLAPPPGLDVDSLLFLKRRFGASAVRFPCVQNGIRFCACGRANELSARICPRCRRRLRGFTNESNRRRRLLHAEFAIALTLIFLLAGICENVYLDRMNAHVIIKILNAFL